MLKFIIAIIVALTGCQHIEKKEYANCNDVLQQLASGCELAGQGTVVAADGVGLVFQLICDIETGNPQLRIVGFSDSPTQHADAIKAGAKDAGECQLGPNPRRVITLEKPLPDMRAGN